MEKLYIVIPAYNEEKNIEELILEWSEVIQKINSISRLVIFDDGSKDKTFSIAKSLSEKIPQVKVIKKNNSGHGPTCLFAYNYAVEKNADYIFQTDSDRQTSPKDFWQFWKNRKSYDFIIGKRVKREDGFFRVIVTFFLKMIIFFIFRIYVLDSNTPFRLMKKDNLEKLLPLIEKDSFLANVMLSVLVVSQKEKLLWLPIPFTPRAKGDNSIYLKKIIKVGLKAILDFYQLKKVIKKKITNK